MRYRFTPLAVAAVVMLVCALAASHVRAQIPDDPIAEQADQPAVTPPPHIESIDGIATVEHQNQTDKAAMSQPLIPGDRIKTERGRVEVVFADGSFLYLDEFTTIEFLDDALVRLSMGRTTLIVRGQDDANTTAARYQVDTPAASVRTDVPGEYRIATLNGRGAPETELFVVRGAAQLATDAGAMMVRAGERSAAFDNVAPQTPQPFNSARYDAFDQWTRARQDAWLGANSTRYLPQDVQMYAGTFDRYGAWGSDPQYGNVWYPTVGPDWRPYYNGYWDYYPSSYGWFWIGADPWVWPTHHYGRWGYARSRWFWIPARRWASAWVSWAISPGFVSWCPLGFDGRPVFGFFNTRVRVAYDPWLAWTVIPRDRFGSRVFVSHHFVDGRRLGTTQAFVVQRSGPRPPDRGRAFVAPRAGAGTTAISGARQPTSQRFDRGIVDPRANNQRRGGVVGQAVPRGGTTRIDPPRGPQSYRGAFGGGASAESPYDRAARVAGERRPGTERQPLPPGNTSYPSPYPPQYRSGVPEPFHPRSGGSPSPQYGSPSPYYPHAVPRGGGNPDGSGGAPPPGVRSRQPGGQPPNGVQPRGGQPGGRGSESAAPPARGGGEQRAQPRGGGGRSGGGSSGNGSSGRSGGRRR